jgi:hypothetical protein
MIDTKTDRKNLYSKLHELDFIGKARSLLTQRGFVVRPDGRLTRQSHAAWDTPWIHQHNFEQKECERWHSLWFPITHKVPSYCKNCWKVVVDIPTVKELFDLYELQKGLGHPCKCGIELRPTDARRYGGYFYSWGKEEGLACYQKVRQAVNEQIGEHINVFLKCACSEYEIECGPPDDWEVTPQQLKVEQMFKNYVVTSDVKFPQHPHMIAYVMLKWLHHAAHIGDMTYKECTNGQPILLTMKTYHKEIEDGTMAK